MSGPAILVVSYGSSALVEENLARTTLPSDAMVVVVDNFTTDTERATIVRIAEAHGWVLLKPSENLGFGTGMNAAADAAITRGATTLLLLNPDAYIDGDGVGVLHAAVAAEPNLLLSPMVVRPDGAHFSSEMEIDMRTGSMRRLIPGRSYADSEPWLSGACLALSANLWEKIGGFSDDYFLYWEDVDFSVRASSVGAILRVEENVRAVHSEGGTQDRAQESAQKSATYYFYNARNRYVFAAQHVSATAQRRWKLGAVGAAWNVLKRGGRRQLLHPSVTVVPVAKGVASGFSYLRKSAQR